MEGGATLCLKYCRLTKKQKGVTVLDISAAATSAIYGRRDVANEDYDENGHHFLQTCGDTAGPPRSESHGRKPPFFPGIPSAKDEATSKYRANSRKAGVKPKNVVPN